MPEFAVNFDEENIEALRAKICAVVDANRERTGLHSMGVSILCTRLMVEIEQKLFELRRKPGPDFDHPFEGELERAALSRLEQILFGDVKHRSTDELEARAEAAMRGWNTSLAERDG